MPQVLSSMPKKADQYNDPTHNYVDYWQGRNYEHEAEVIAIKRLLKGKHFKHAIDIGGGFGRLCPILLDYADEVTLAEPSQQQLDLAADFLKDYPQIKRRLMQADKLLLDDNGVDLITMVRVLHHLPDPATEFREIGRVLSPSGLAIIEMANYAHFENRLKHLLKAKKLPTQPVDIRSEQNKRADVIPFVNHNPKTIISQLAAAGLKVERVLSVSNLRSPSLKKIMPKSAMLIVEKAVQPVLAPVYFGPSIFLLVKKAA